MVQGRFRILSDEERKAKRKARDKARRTTPEYKAKDKEKRDRPENKAKDKEKRSTPKFKANANKRNKKYFSSEKGKTTNKKAQKKYSSSEKGKNFIKKYKSSGKNSVCQKKYSSSEKGKAGQKKFKSSEKGSTSVQLKVLRHYSKLHSNSNISCCRCCGLNGHTDFLAIDHIQGRREMKSIKELVEIKYTSTLEGYALARWIIKNNYLLDLQTEYFQILCHNCNAAKGYPRNKGKCPMENKPH